VYAIHYVLTQGVKYSDASTDRRLIFCDVMSYCLVDFYQHIRGTSVNTHLDDRYLHSDQHLDPSKNVSTMLPSKSKNKYFDMPWLNVKPSIVYYICYSHSVNKETYTVLNQDWYSCYIHYVICRYIFSVR
jgi:hypothetical protein